MNSSPADPSIEPDQLVETPAGAAPDVQPELAGVQPDAEAGQSVDQPDVQPDQ